MRIASSCCRRSTFPVTPGKPPLTRPRSATSEVVASAADQVHPSVSVFEGSAGPTQRPGGDVGSVTPSPWTGRRMVHSGTHKR